jgi:hypothetical protein
MIIKNNPKNFGKIYNVEFYLGNGQISTFSNILVNVGDGYFYFEDEAVPGQAEHVQPCHLR